MMDIFVIGAFEVATKKQTLDSSRKVRIDRQGIFDCSVLQAGLSHNDLAVFFQDVSLQFAGIFIYQRYQFRFTAYDRIPNLLDTTGTETVCPSRKTQRRS